jgi:ATP-dependent Clp protease ATP-binding subunit ClpA
VFDRFTDRARKCMGLARQEAQRFNHDYIGTEHILLGLVQEGSGVAASVLKNLDIDLKKIRQEVEKLVSTGTTMVTMGQLPFTPRAKKVLEYSLEEATRLRHSYIGSEHFLLGLLREGEGVAAQVLRHLRVGIEDVRRQVLEVIAGEPLAPEDLTAGPYAADRRWHRVGPIFTQVALTTMGYAGRLAMRRNVSVGPAHLLGGLLLWAADAPKQKSLASLLGVGDVDALSNAARARADAVSGPPPTEGAQHSVETLRVLARALTRAAERGAVQASEADLLVALVADEGPETRWLREHGVDVERIRRG